MKNIKNSINNIDRRINKQILLLLGLIGLINTVIYSQPFYNRRGYGHGYFGNPYNQEFVYGSNYPSSPEPMVMEPGSQREIAQLPDKIDVDFSSPLYTTDDGAQGF